MADGDANGIILSKSAYLKRLVAIAVLLNLFFISIQLLSLRQSRVQYEEKAVISTRNLALVLEKQLIGIIDKINLTLLAVSDEARQQSAHGAINVQQMNNVISRLHTRLPEIDSLRATNAQGDIVFGVGVDPKNIVKIDDRDYFTQPRNSRTGLVVSKPVLGRINGKWNLILSRSINLNDDSFAGIAFATITLEQLSKNLSELDVGRNGTVVLLDDNFGFVVGHPAALNTTVKVGQRNPSKALLEQVKAGHTSGTYTAITGAAQIERTVSFRKISPYPLYIVVAFANQDYLAGWWEDLTHESGFTLCFMLLTMLASWLLFRNWKLRTAAQEQINQLVYYDTLTELPNRRLLTDRLEQAFVQAKRFGRSLAVMFLDLDHFKEVNDTLGHACGDELLKVVAKRLLASVRSIDTVCRQGGDEFIIVLPEINQEQDAELVADKIIKAISEPFNIQDNKVHVTTSIGIAVHQIDGADDAAMLMKKADMAMYEAKSSGRNRFCCHQSEVLL